MKQLKGTHHITLITSSAEQIYHFFTNIMEMRLVKKTINQDDIETYHLFFADDRGNPGTDVTFFDFKGASKAIRGRNEIRKTAFRVADDKALDYWLKRFTHYKIKHTGIETLFGKKVIYFEDFDEQQYVLISDQDNKGVKTGTAWLKGPVPNEFGITGLGPAFLYVNDLERIYDALTKGLFMRKSLVEGDFTLYEMGEGGNGGSVVVVYSNEPFVSYQGYGGVHHLAFRVDNKEDLANWEEHFNKLRAPNSGYVDRFYFESLYVRLYPNVLFELATDEPGFIDDEESYEILGETLALPPKFRNKRAYVEKIVRPINTVRSTKKFEKEYF